MPASSPKSNALVSVADQSTAVNTTFGSFSKSQSESSLRKSTQIQMPSMAMLYEDPADNEPGPGTYALPSAIGTQPSSTKQSAPSPPMLAKNAHSWSKVFMSKYQQSVFLCRDSPGAVYNPKLPKQTRNVRFGRGAERAPKGMYNTDSPGPVYEVVGEPGKHAKVATFGVGNRKNFLCGDPHIDVAPGEYDPPSCFDGEHLAKSFGISYDEYGPTAKELLGRESPGPGLYTENFGKNLPQYRFSGRAKMGKGLRPQPKRSQNPPPGAYEITHYSVAKPKCVDSQVWNYPAHNWGKPSMRGRFDFKMSRAWSEGLGKKLSD